jgi:hypothetical protein
MATNSIAISKDVAAISSGGSGSRLGRFLPGADFLMAGANHFNKQTIGYAASQGCLWLQSRFRFPALWPLPGASAFCWAIAQK